MRQFLKKEEKKRDLAGSKKIKSMSHSKVMQKQMTHQYESPSRKKDKQSPLQKQFIALEKIHQEDVRYVERFKKKKKGLNLVNSQSMSKTVPSSPVREEERIEEKEQEK